jgi:hypothetical protein
MGGSLQPEGVAHPRMTIQRSGGEGDPQAGQHHHRPREPGQRSPPPRRELAVGEEQDEVDAEQSHRGYPYCLGQSVARHGVGPGAGDGVPRKDEYPEQTDGQADPAYRVFGVPGGDQGTTTGKARKETKIDRSPRVPPVLVGSREEKAMTRSSKTLARNMATHRPASDQASQGAARVLVPPIPCLRSLAPAVTTPLYSTNFS